MDYCSSCRRHLNGALACPGCGAYAPDIAPPATAGRIGSNPATTTDAGPAATAAREPSACDTWRDGPLQDEEKGNTDWDAAVNGASSADVEWARLAREGRAARRRQLTRWKKNKRRAAVATAVAFVGAGLTIATMDRHSPDRARAATAPDTRSMGAAEEQTPKYTRPASTPPITGRSAHTTPEAQPPALDAPRQQPLAAPPRTTPPVARPEAVAPPAPAAPSATLPQNNTPSSNDSAPDRTGATAEQPSTPATADSTDSGTPETGPSPASTSPTELCLLVVCLG
ncbi:SCO2400 family protein [Streptomyces sp. Tue6028]|uniref:SCO2400 family protein n=1 Tax=Streptomyces sp. Tue6028 TaxID=2036037 RepID=UPI003EB9C78D